MQTDRCKVRIHIVHSACSTDMYGICILKLAARTLHSAHGQPEYVILKLC